MKVVEGWGPGDDVDEQVIEFVLSVALSDVLARAQGSQRSPAAGLARVWEGAFVIVPERQPRQEGRRPARRRAADRRTQPAALDGISSRDRRVAQGLAELLAEWAEAQNAG